MSSLGLTVSYSVVISSAGWATNLSLENLQRKINLFDLLLRWFAFLIISHLQCLPNSFLLQCLSETLSKKIVKDKY